MSQPTLSEDEFTRLQEQLITLRTENYELGSRLQKTQTDLSSVQEKCTSQEKELARVNKLMKFPGFQAITKNKRKGNYDEIVEENERLNRQMQRHEEDFNLQNKTLLEEVSRVSSERDQLLAQLKQMTEEKSQTTDDSGEVRRLKAENAALQKAIRDKMSDNTASDEATSQSATSSNGPSETSEEEPDGHPLDVCREKLSELRLQLVDHLENSFTNVTDNMNRTDEEKATVNLEIITQVIDNHITTFSTQLQILQNQIGRNLTHSTSDLAMKLETEVAEKNLLIEQLNQERETFKKETGQLKDERDKLKDKNRKKQESFLQIQGDKDKLYNEKRSLEENLVKVTGVLEQQQGELGESRRMIEALRDEKNKIEEEVELLKEKSGSSQPGNIDELQKSLKDKTDELSDLEANVEDMKLINRGLEDELLRITDERDKIQSLANESAELAESRKTLLDEIAIEKQVMIERQSDDLKQLRAELQVQRDAVSRETSAKEELKTEVTQLQEKMQIAEQKADSSEKKSGWLERTLQETEEVLNKERADHANEIKQLRVTHENELQEAEEELQKRLQDEKITKESLKRELDEQKLLVGKLNQATKDREVEYRINNKKGDHLVKDLKRQLVMEKKRADQIQQRLQEFLAEAKVKQTFDELFTNDSMQYKTHRRQDSGSHLSNISSISNTETDEGEAIKASSPSRRADQVVTSETMDLINRLADLQQDKWILEEKVRHLEENGAVMADDLMKKTSIIQAYVMETKPDNTPEHSRKKHLTLREKVIDTLKSGKSEETLKEMTNKLQRMLEETLVKNIQLEQDVDHLSQELQDVKSAGSPTSS